MKGEIECRGVEFNDDGDHLVLNVEARNTSKRTLHAYGSVRGLRYDDSTKTLKVLMTERGLSEKPFLNLAVQPRIVAIDPGGASPMTLSLPRFLSKLGSGPTPAEAIVQRQPNSRGANHRSRAVVGRHAFLHGPASKEGAARAARRLGEGMRDRPRPTKGRRQTPERRQEKAKGRLNGGRSRRRWSWVPKRALVSASDAENANKEHLRQQIMGHANSRETRTRRRKLEFRSPLVGRRVHETRG